MRVIAGAAKGRLLRAPGGLGTRPTSDRVREAMFATLTSVTALDGLATVDLFAGSGALGIEALSRGAGSAVFVERHPLALAAIRANLELVDPGAQRGRVVRADARRWSPPSGVGVDVVFADPPYAFDGWEQLLGRWVRWATLAVLETDRELEPGPAWQMVKQKRYGATVVTVARAVEHNRGNTVDAA